MGFKDIVYKKELKFEDRTLIIEDVKKSYQTMMQSKTFFQIISITGMGGIGKSRLLKELKNILKETYNADKKQVIIHITLEIAGSDSFLNALISLRSQIDEVCPLFDYAFLIYWKRSQISKLDESFLNIFKQQWLNASKWLGSMFSLPIDILNISFDTILEFLENIFGFLKERYYKNFFQNRIRDISEYSTEELKDCLSGFLGIDINRIFCEKHLCIFIDSYKCYPSVSYDDWLMDLIEQSNTGLFIISCREKILFPCEIQKYALTKKLEELPEDCVSTILKENIPNITDPVIHHLSTVTGRIPIYVDLAVNTYKNVYPQNTEFDETHFFMYKNRQDIIKAFFNHLKPCHQEFLLPLSFLQLFDRDIFNYVLTLCPSASILDYSDFQLFSIIANIENDNEFYKVHDVLNTNVIYIIDYDTRLYLFRGYLKHIVSKTIFYVTDTQKIVLYKHIINMIIKNKFIPKQEECELLLDLFFSLKQTLHILLPVGIPEMESYEPLKDINYFTKAVANERESTLVRLEYLKCIDFDNNMFGKHNKSLRIIYGFLTQWIGDSTPLVNYLATEYPLLKDTEIREWYYAQTIIFWADYLTITGKFKTAQQVLDTFRKKLVAYSEQENSTFQTIRHTGHIFRFNMFLDSANQEYFSVMDKNQNFKNSFQEIYIITNICETNCYLNPDIVFHYCYKGIQLGKMLKDLKSQAKIYYSMAIASIHQKKYHRAKKYIRKSMSLDMIDGYQLGIISSMLANIYLQFAQGVPIDYERFEKYLARFDVYGFQILPLALIKQDKVQIQSIRIQYEWLNYEKTINAYNEFFIRIQSQYSDNNLMP